MNAWWHRLLETCGQGGKPACKACKKSCHDRPCAGTRPPLWACRDDSGHFFAIEAASQNGGGDLFNTAAGWVLFAGVVGLGLSILSGKYFHGDSPERPEQLGYVIEGAVEQAAGPAEMSIAEALNAASWWLI